MKKWMLISVLLLGLVAAGVTGLKQYRTWRQTSLIKRAQQCLAQSDFRNASLCARQAHETNPNDIDAARVLAELAELGHKTNALFFRQRIAELQPKNPTNHLMLARSALLFSAHALAQKALDSLDDAGRRSADYHKIQANLFWATGRLNEAAHHFEEAYRMEPTNLVSQVNLNVVRLPSTNQALATAARARLIALTTNSAVRSDILRQLITDAEFRRQPAEALRYSKSLIQGDDASLQDQMRHGTLLRLAKDPTGAEHLSRMQMQCATNAAKAATLGRWMIGSDMGQQSIAWAQSLPEATRKQRPVTLMLAEAYLATTNWARLAKHLENRPWDEDEHFRELLLARVAREERNTTGFRSHWLRALKAASGNADKLGQLAHLTETWRWRDEMEESLGALVARFPEQKWAEDILSASLHLGGKTQALQNLFARTLEREPTNNLAKSNFATLGLLLNPAEKQFHRLAEEAFQAQGTNAFVASTYALSLHFQHQTARAIQIMESIPANNLENPVIATWYGFLLSEGGHRERARKYLQLAEKARLLPEERRLLDKARGQG